MGERGWVTATSTDNGHIAWKAYNTGPDTDVLIGPQFKPFYPQDQGKDLGVSTWPLSAWHTGGGTMWGWISYDPELNLLYHGTANPGPWNADQRPGDNKWTCGIFARNPDNGEARWFYQWSPHDLQDYDGMYGCGSCHTIPGIQGAHALVGPSLAQVASRMYIAGVLPNTPTNILRWLQNP